MKIRAIKESDIDECSSLFAKVFSSPPWNEEWTKDLAFKRLSHFYESKDFLGVVAEEDNIVGFALGNIEPFYFGSMLYLREMCVDSVLQRKGIGSGIIDALDSELSNLNVKRVYLATERTIPAANFYQSKGFVHNEALGFYAKSVNS